MAFLASIHQTLYSEAVLLHQTAAMKIRTPVLLKMSRCVRNLLNHLVGPLKTGAGMVILFAVCRILSEPCTGNLAPLGQVAKCVDREFGSTRLNRPNVTAELRVEPPGFQGYPLYHKSQSWSFGYPESVLNRHV